MDRARDGKEFVQIDHMQFGPDPQQDIEPLKFIRDNIVANLYVPPAHVGIEENVGNRSLLTVESIIFSRIVISYQRELSIPLTRLFSKIYKLVHGEDVSDFLTITFPPPKAAPYEYEAEYIEKVSRIATSYDELGVPKMYTRKKYLPDIDWDEIEKEMGRAKIHQDLGFEDSDDSSGGSFSGF